MSIIGYEIYYIFECFVGNHVQRRKCENKTVLDFGCDLDWNFIFRDKNVENISILYRLYELNLISFFSCKLRCNLLFVEMCNDIIIELLHRVTFYFVIYKNYEQVVLHSIKFSMKIIRAS